MCNYRKSNSTEPKIWSDCRTWKHPLQSCWTLNHAFAHVVTNITSNRINIYIIYLCRYIVKTDKLIKTKNSIVLNLAEYLILKRIVKSQMTNHLKYY